MKRKLFHAAVNFFYLPLNLFLILVCTLVPFYYSIFGVSIIKSAVSVYTDRIIFSVIIATVHAVLSFMFFGALRYLNSSPPKTADTSGGIAVPCSAEQ